MGFAIKRPDSAFSLDKSSKCSVEGCDKPRRTLGLCKAHRFRLEMHGDPLGGGTSKGELTAWLERHADYDGDGCLKWPYHCNKNGSAYAKAGGRSIKAARLMCLIAHGEPPTPKHEAAHECGKAHEGCVHPKHLRWATKKENQADRLIHGTDGRGSKNSASKLAEADVIEIRRRSKTETNVAIAASFGVSHQTIALIKSGRNWGWLKDG